MVYKLNVRSTLIFRHDLLSYKLFLSKQKIQIFQYFLKYFFVELLFVRRSIKSKNGNDHRVHLNAFFPLHYFIFLPYVHILESYSMFIIQNLTHPLTMKIFLNTLLLLSNPQPPGLKIYPRNKILNIHRKIHCKKFET